MKVHSAETALCDGAFALSAALPLYPGKARPASPPRFSHSCQGVSVWEEALKERPQVTLLVLPLMFRPGDGSLPHHKNGDIYILGQI